METIHAKHAKVFKAFCDERRLRILQLLRGGEKCACVLIDEVGMPQSSLSYHMKILCESGIVEAHEDGKWTHYQINDVGCREAMALLESITMPDAAKDECVCGLKDHFSDESGNARCH